MRAARRAGVLEAELQAFLHGGYSFVAARVAGNKPYWLAMLLKVSPAAVRWRTTWDRAASGQRDAWTGIATPKGISPTSNRYV